jgi:hypothetical protein
MLTIFSDNLTNTHNFLTPIPAFPHGGDRPVRKQPFGCFQGGARLSDGLRGNLTPSLK